MAISNEITEIYNSTDAIFNLHILEYKCDLIICRICQIILPCGKHLIITE